MCNCGKKKPCGGGGGCDGEDTAQTAMIFSVMTAATRASIVAQLATHGFSGSYEVAPGHFISAEVQVNPGLGVTAVPPLSAALRGFDIGAMFDLVAGTHGGTERRLCGAFKVGVADPWTGSYSKSRFCCGPDMGSKYSKHSVAICIKHTVQVP